MRISKLSPGFHTDGLECVIHSQSLLSSTLLRLTVADHTGTVNLLVSVEEYISPLQQVYKDTKLYLSDFLVSEDYSKVTTHIPQFLTSSVVAMHGSDSSWFIWIDSDSQSIIKIINNQTTLVLDRSVQKSQIESLYMKKSADVAQTTKLMGPNNEKYSSLDYIYQNVGKSEPLASCYAVVIDVTSPYKTPNISDYLTALKISDASIFPASASVVIFHREKTDMPKVAGIGDIIRLNDFTFKIYNDCLSAQKPSNNKHPKFCLFPLEDGITSYANDKNPLYQSSDHFHHLTSIRSWAKYTLAQAIPDCLKNTKFLSSASGECDILVKVHDICNMGSPLDPISLICYDSRTVNQLVVPYERKKMLKYVKPGMTVRIRSVICESGCLYMTYYTDILVVSESISLLQFSVESDLTEELERAVGVYRDIEPTLGSITDSDAKATRIISFSKARNIATDETCRVEGYLLNVSPNTPAKMFCVKCKKDTDALICHCNFETESKSEIELCLWDRNGGEIMTVYVPEKDCVKFLNGVEWSYLKTKYCDPMVKLELGLIGGPRLEVIGTKLIQI